MSESNFFTNPHTSPSKNNNNKNNGEDSPVKLNVSKSQSILTSPNFSRLTPLKHEMLDYISISAYKSLKNHYLINLEKYFLYKKKNGIVRNTIREFESFNFLDIDHKTQIRSFPTFIYNNYTNLTTPTNNNTSTNSISLTGSGGYFNTSAHSIAPQLHSTISFGQQSIKKTGNNECKEINNYPHAHSSNDLTPHVADITSSVLNNTRINVFQIPNPPAMGKKRKKLNGENAISKDVFTNDNYNISSSNNTTSYTKIVERPKYETKFTSFEMDANDINLINEFMDPDPKYLVNSEYLQTDDFINMDISKENYGKIFDDNFGDSKQIFEDYCKNSSTEFKEEMILRFNNASPKKNEKKLTEMKDVDYLVYVVDEKQFYKKFKAQHRQPCLP